MSNVCTKCIDAETKMGAAKRNCQDRNQRDQGYVARQQVVPFAGLNSTAEKSQIWIGAAAAAWKGFPFCWRDAGCGPKKLKVLQ